MGHFETLLGLFYVVKNDFA